MINLVNNYGIVFGHLDINVAAGRNAVELAVCEKVALSALPAESFRVGTGVFCIRLDRTFGDNFLCIDQRIRDHEYFRSIS